MNRDVGEILRAYRNSINSPRRLKDFLIIFFTLLILLLIPLTATAVQKSRDPSASAYSYPTLYFYPSRKTVKPYQYFYVYVKEDSNYTKVNAVTANIKYDQTRFNLTSLYCGYGFEIRVKCTYNKRLGYIYITSGTRTSKKYHQYIARIRFRVIPRYGYGRLNFLSSSKLVSSTTHNNILMSRRAGYYYVSR
jgi:hypothetical protein